jgi:hypothetical protein
MVQRLLQFLPSGAVLCLPGLVLVMPAFPLVALMMQYCLALKRSLSPAPSGQSLPASMEEITVEKSQLQRAREKER